MFSDLYNEKSFTQYYYFFQLCKNYFKTICTTDAKCISLIVSFLFKKKLISINTSINTKIRHWIYYLRRNYISFIKKTLKTLNCL